MEGLASQAKPAHIRAFIEVTIKPPTCAQGHAFQAHSLQIILLGPFAYELNVIHGLLQIVSLQLAPFVGKGLRVGSGGGGVEPLSSKGLRGCLHFQRHAFVVQT